MSAPSTVRVVGWCSSANGRAAARFRLRIGETAYDSDDHRRSARPDVLRLMPGTSPLSGFTVVFNAVQDAVGTVAVHPIDDDGVEHPPLVLAKPVSLQDLKVEALASHPLKPILRAALPHFSPSIVFDVGANVGQSIQPLRGMFPHATIHSFEPAPSTFAELMRGFGSVDRSVLHQMAIGARDGFASFTDKPLSVANRIVEGGEPNIQIARIDSICRDLGLADIGYLKIDAEGHELEILAGCGHFLGKISMIECEVSANRYNRYHRSFEEISSISTTAIFPCSR